MGKYTISTEVLTNEYTSHGKVLSRINPNSLVLEFGPASGMMTEYLKDTLNCCVYIVEYDNDDYEEAIKFAEDGVCGDASKLEWLEKFSHIRFDYILFSDILEHLYDPAVVLKKAKSLLKNDGRIFVSVPNIAHNSIILNLIDNKFEYKKEGLLDNTHIRFFTYYSALEMLEIVGLKAIREDATYVDPINTEFKNDYDIINGNVKILREKQFDNVYQFVFEAIKKEHYYENKDDFVIEKIIKENNYAQSNATIYFDTGNGFNEDEIIIIPYNGENFFQRFPVPPNTKHIRFDPLEGNSCVIKNLEVSSNVGSLTFNNVNGFNINDYHMFFTNDPNFVIYVKPNIEWVTIEAKIYVNEEDYFPAFLSNVHLMEQEKSHFEKTSARNIAELREKLLQETKKRDDELFRYHTAVIEKDEELERQYNSIIDKDNEIANYSKHYHAAINQLHAMQNSTFWRLTKPARFTVRVAKWFFRKFPLTRSIYKGLSKMRHGGTNQAEEAVNLIYDIDVCEFNHNTLNVSGWLFLPDGEISEVKISIKTSTTEYETDTLYKTSRKDVYEAYRKSYPNLTENLGFQSSFTVENLSNFKVVLNYFANDQWNMLTISEIKNSFSNKLFYYRSKLNRRNMVKLMRYLSRGDLKSLVSYVNTPRVHPQSSSSIENIDMLKWLSENFNKNSDVCSSNYVFEGEIDIIIPVYNGFEHLDPLFESIQKTGLRYNLYIVEDCSTDERVKPYLKKIESLNKNVKLIENESNQGFVKSVNTALKQTKNHVALLNTDIELPQLWLERLMYPIIFEENVASTTPFTNSGTLCSFPNFGEDNSLFQGLTLAQIDEGFSHIKPSYIPMPTGVGFCMGMNSDAIKEVGRFDEKVFLKGYGEENDWCQRAIKKGYTNVLVDNLFVYHKHGGSFLSDEKKVLIERNGKQLEKKHSNYATDVAFYFTQNPAKHIRNFVAMQLLSANVAKKQILIFDHIIGGGATSYLNSKISGLIEKSCSSIVVRYDFNKGVYLFKYQAAEHTFIYVLKNINDLQEVLSYFPCSEIIINELVTYPNLSELMDLIIHLKDEYNLKITMLMHDYFAICPSINLLDTKFKYCDIPDASKCKNCFKTIDNFEDFANIEKWRSTWGDFLANCDDIVCFSNSSKAILEKAYNIKLNISIVPHVVSYIPKLSKTHKTTSTINIGLIGDMSVHKGSQIVQDMLSVIEKQNMNVRIILVGSSNNHIASSRHFKETGRYELHQLPTLTLQNDIDIFFISSIWPETFSYTTEEVIKMDMPIACFNIGASVERVSVYEKGLVIDNIDAKSVLTQIYGFVKNYHAPSQNLKVMFVTDYISFSSRYRVDHFKEQLLMQGINSDFFEAEAVNHVEINDYDVFVIYRCQYTNKLKTFIDNCHASSKKVFYDIDDYIFEYDKIKNLEFLSNGKHHEYAGFEKYSNEIKKCMSLCDGFITSTNHMEKAIKNTFPKKPVHINRNVASLEMGTASLIAKNTVTKKKDKIILGYFSGSKTHDKDFEIIEPVIISLFEQYENLYLKTVGVLTIGENLKKYDDRIIKVDFVPWQKLPQLIASVNINLMPLESSFFHSCKSENKWMEAALVLVPTVCSFNEELDSVINNGVTGFICSTTEEWEETLISIIENPEKASIVAEAAHKIVCEKYITTYTGKEAKDFIFESLSGNANWEV